MKKSILWAFCVLISFGAHGNSLLEARQEALATVVNYFGEEPIFSWRVERANLRDNLVMTQAQEDSDITSLGFICHYHGVHMACHFGARDIDTKGSYFSTISYQLMLQAEQEGLHYIEQLLINRGEDLQNLFGYQLWKDFAIQQSDVKKRVYIEFWLGFPPYLQTVILSCKEVQDSSEQAMKCSPVNHTGSQPEYPWGHHVN